MATDWETEFARDEVPRHRSKIAPFVVGPPRMRFLMAPLLVACCLLPSGAMMQSPFHRVNSLPRLALGRVEMTALQNDAEVESVRMQLAEARAAKAAANAEVVAASKELAVAKAAVTSKSGRDSKVQNGADLGGGGSVLGPVVGLGAAGFLARGAAISGKREREAKKAAEAARKAASQGQATKIGAAIAVAAAVIVAVSSGGGTTVVVPATAPTSQEQHAARVEAAKEERLVSRVEKAVADRAAAKEARERTDAARAAKQAAEHEAAAKRAKERAAKAAKATADKEYAARERAAKAEAAGGMEGYDSGKALAAGTVALGAAFFLASRDEDEDDMATKAVSVQQACAFMAANPTIDVEQKRAFLQSKGVSDFVIAQSTCVAPEDNVQG